MKTTFKLILMLGFLCLLKPETAKAQSFPTQYAIINQTSCTMIYDILITDLNGTCFTSTASISLSAGNNDLYDLPTLGCGAVQDITVTAYSVSVDKTNINTQVSISSACGTNTMQWAYGGMIFQ